MIDPGSQPHDSTTLPGEATGPGEQQNARSDQPRSPSDVIRDVARRRDGALGDGGT